MSIERMHRNPDRTDRWKPADQPSVAADAVDVVRQMVAHYGTGVGKWTSYELDTVVWRGERGMRNHA